MEFVILPLVIPGDGSYVSQVRQQPCHSVTEQLSAANSARRRHSMVAVRQPSTQQDVLSNPCQLTIVFELDFSSAFNSVHRDVMLNAVLEKVAGIYKFCSYRIASRPSLFTAATPFFPMKVHSKETL